MATSPTPTPDPSTPAGPFKPRTTYRIEHRISHPDLTKMVFDAYAGAKRVRLPLTLGTNAPTGVTQVRVIVQRFGYRAADKSITFVGLIPNGTEFATISGVFTGTEFGEFTLVV